MLYRPEVPTASPVPVVIRTEPRQGTGCDLAHCKRTPVERALLTADIKAGRVIVVDLTLSQIIRLTGASPTYASAAVKLGAGERRSVANGWRPLIPQNGQRAKSAPSLAEAWDRASPEEREVAVRPRAAQVWGAIERVIA